MKIDSKLRVQNYVLHGLHYGYPECCILYFHLRQFNGDLEAENEENRRNWAEGKTWELKRPLDGTGYICCPECQEKYTKEEQIERIKERRLRAEPFPEDRDGTLDQEKAKTLEAATIISLTNRTIKTIEREGASLEDWPEGIEDDIQERTRIHELPPL